MKRFLFLTISTIVSISLYAQSRNPMHTAVDANVSAMGGATANVNIYAPPGRKGITPSISISYNSMAGEANMGIGWSLNALSAISLSGRNFHLDNGVQETVTLSGSDNFTLDGERLILISGTKGAANSEYRTEHDRFVRVVFDGASFVVDTKDGSKLFYGNTVDSKSKPMGSSVVVSWLLKRSYDVNGNYVEYVYNNSNGEVNLAEIKYGGYDNSINGTVASGATQESCYNKITFEYDNAINNQLKYIGGFAINQTKILTKISSFAGTTKAREYTFTYTNDNVSSYLTQIQEKNGANEALKPVDITWTNEEQPQRTNTTLYTRYEFIRMIGDFDGDGKKDLLTIDGELDPYNNKLLGTSNTLRVYKYIPPVGASVGRHTIIMQYAIPYDNVSSVMVSDVDADGDDDVVFQVISDKRTHEESDDGGWMCSSFKKYYLDELTFKYHLMQSINSTKLNYAQFDNFFPDRVISNPQNVHVSSTDQYLKLLMILPLIGDVDGDGLPDLIERATQGERSLIGSCNSASQTSVIPEKNNSYIRLHLSSKRKEIAVSSRYIDYGFWKNIVFIPTDFNGNGKLDLMIIKNDYDQTEILELNSNNTALTHIYGNGTNQFPTQNHKYLKLADFNGDGKTDLLYFVNSNWMIAYSDGKNFQEFNATSLWFLHNYNKPYCLSPGINFEIGDYNGDGKSDILERHNHAQNAGNDHAGNYVYIYYSKGFGFHKEYIGTNTFSFSPSGNGFNDDYNLTADFDGDGKSDVLQVRYFNYLDNHDCLYESIRGKSKRIENIQFSNAHSISFEYNKLTQSTSYIKDIARSKMSMANLVSLPMFIVKKVTAKINGFPDQTTEYVYKNLLYHTHGRGLLGFTDMAIIKPTLTTGKNNTLVNSFVQNVELPYKLDLKTTSTYNHCTDKNDPFTSAKDLISKVETEYSQIQTSNAGTIFSYNSYSIETNYLTDVVKITCADYDKYGNMVHMATQWGNAASYTIIHTSSIDSKYAKFGTWLPSSAVLVRSTDTHKSMPPHADEIVYTYNTKGLVIAKERYKYNLAYYLKEVTTYDKYGNMASTAFDYANNTTPDLFRRQTTLYDNGKFPKSSTNSLGHTKLFEYEPIYGNVIMITDYNGMITTMQYDNWGQLLKENYPDGNFKEHKQELTNSFPSAYSFTQTLTNLGEESTTYYDARGKKIHEETLGFGGKIHAQDWVYDNDGRLQKQSTIYDLQEPSEANWNFFSYDQYNRMNKTLFNNQEVTYSASFIKLIKYEQFGRNKKVETTYDEMGNVIKVVDKGGEITYKYGAHKQLVETVTNGAVIKLEYNVQLNKTKLNDPNSGVTEYDYTPFGELLAQKDANGNQTNFLYDDLGRLVKKVVGNNQFSYNYINLRGSASNNKISKEELKIGGSTAHQRLYTYDGTTGLLNSVSEAIEGGTPRVTSYLYDANQRLKGINYPNFGVRYAYGIGQDIINIEDASGNPLWKKNNTTNDGKTNEFEYGNGYITNIGFTPKNILASIKSEHNNNGLRALNVEYNFEFLTGNLDAKYFPDVNNHEGYNHDQLDRLIYIGSSHPGNPYAVIMDLKSYAYDNSGNGIQNSNGSLQEFTYHNTKLHAVTKHKFDENISPYRVPQGSLDNHVYTYNSIGKLASIVQAQYEYNLTYGIDDERIKTVMKENGTETYTKTFVNSASMEIKNGIELTYLYAEGVAFAIHKKTAEGEEIVYLHNDYQASIMAITNAVGNIIETRSYDAWGRPRDPITWEYQLNPFTAANITDRGYTFHEHLIEFSLINMNGRMYDPVVGRIISPDNYIQDPYNTQSYNRYSYCWNNPLKYSDPSGDIIFTAAALIAAPFTGGATLALLPTTIGADLMMWQGGSIANGTANPLKWDYTSGKTWGYMGVGAGFGAVAGFAGAGVAASGAPLANTAAIAFSSYFSSASTAVLTGNNNISISFGLASYSSTSGWNGIWNWSKNSAMENLGYSLGAIANISDGVGLYDHLQASKNTPSGLSKEELIELHDKYSNTNLNNKILYGEGNYAGNSAPGISPQEFLDAGIPLKGNDGLGNIFGGFHHDLGYYNAGTDGVRGVLFNTNVTKVDWSLARGMANYIKQPGLTANQISAARRIRDVFTAVSAYKTIIRHQYIINFTK